MFVSVYLDIKRFCCRVSLFTSLFYCVLNLASLFVRVFFIICSNLFLCSPAFSICFLLLLYCKLNVGGNNRRVVYKAWSRF